MSDLSSTPVGMNALVAAGAHDVKVIREKTRQHRLLKAALIAAVCTAPVSLWLFAGAPLPTVDPVTLTMILFFVVLALAAVLPMLITNGSPHTTLTPEQVEVGFDDVAGIGPTKGQVVDILNLFLTNKTFKDKMGGRAHRGVLFEGAPGTGKTHMAKALAREAGVPFLFLPATSVQSMWHGGSAKKIRSFFKALREAARKEGGAIGFIEEIDAIALKRGGMAMSDASSFQSTQASESCCGGLDGLPAFNGMSPSVSHPATVTNSLVSEGGAGTVNELLIQMQSFDEPTGLLKVVHKMVANVNSYLPEKRRIRLKPVEPANILIIAATNRGDQLDPALLRPGRFDRRITFDLPSKHGRRELIDYFLSKKSHDKVLGSEEYRDALAALLSGYSPVMIENLLDEALSIAVTRGSTQMSWADIQHARMTITIGVGQPVEYTAHEERLIASHEAGHATMAWLVAPERRLEVLTTIKRGGALGLLAHGDTEDRFTRSRSEMLSLIQVAMGGQVAEELLFGGEVSTGPASDLAYATNIAVQMVGAAGMGRSLVSLQAAGGGMMDGGLASRVLGSQRGLSEVDEILNLAKDRTRQLLEQNLSRVEALRDALLARKELIGTEINEVLESVGPHPEVEPLKLPRTA